MEALQPLQEKDTTDISHDAFLYICNFAEVLPGPRQASDARTVLQEHESERPALLQLREAGGRILI